KWYFAKPPVTENSYALQWGNVALLYAGLQLAGPHLTPENFRAGIFAADPGQNLNGKIDTLVTYGSHGLCPGHDPDVTGLDNAGILWWDPNATGEDETGAVGKGMYRLVDGGKRYLPGQWPTDPIPLFNDEGTVTIYDKRPADIVVKEYPPIPGSPAA